MRAVFCQTKHGEAVADFTGLYDCFAVESLARVRFPVVALR